MIRKTGLQPMPGRVFRQDHVRTTGWRVMTIRHEIASRAGTANATPRGACRCR
jgi:hypothetical protein